MRSRTISFGPSLNGASLQRNSWTLRGVSSSFPASQLLPIRRQTNTRISSASMVSSAGQPGINFQELPVTNIVNQNGVEDFSSSFPTARQSRINGLRPPVQTQINFQSGPGSIDGNPAQTNTVSGSGGTNFITTQDGGFTMMDFSLPTDAMGTGFSNSMQAQGVGQMMNVQQTSSQARGRPALNNMQTPAMMANAQIPLMGQNIAPQPQSPPQVPNAAAPTGNATGMTFQSAFPGLPPVTVPDYGDDSWFTYLKAVLDRAMPNPPPLMRNTAPIAEPIPRRMSDLPRGSSPIYLINLRGGPAYIPYVLPNQLHPIYVPFNRETRELMYPYLPLYLPYPNAGINRDDIGMRFVAYIPFQPDRFRNSREGAPLIYPHIVSNTEFPMYVDYRPVSRPVAPNMVRYPYLVFI